MAQALLSPTHSLSKFGPLFQPNLPNHSGKSPSRRKERCSSRRVCVVSSFPAKPILREGFGVPEEEEGCVKRRGLVFLGLCSSASLVLPLSALAAVEMDEAVKSATLVDDTNAYSFTYPMELPSKKFTFKWVESRKPERYSSAAPLSPDARQRIVSERVDMINNLVISVSIGPPNSNFLISTDKNTWNAKDVADSVLSDKSALRITTAQRMAESSVLDAHSTKIDGEPYWYYEYLIRKSPTKSIETNSFRHFVATTAERDGFLYSLTASTLSTKWDFMGPLLQNTVASFRLLPPTDSYVPPYKDPWRFW
ncbi:hypothetical protein QJS10_CPA07g00525 [Acorus calamus]|uniref:PsbP C-terminal domain-containing protein n=1 Tax=Acorus calamus TaxID=4465 RepID=A0AAV9EE99_ACOCL|nr:hypothetical protein QJS10_CPA07g00525 [Acorus calamus]